MASGATVVHHSLYTLPDDARAVVYHDHLFAPNAAPAPQTPVSVPGAVSAATFTHQNSDGTYAT